MEEDRNASETERMRRWRLILGKDSEESTCALTGESLKMDAVLQALYGGGGAGKSARGRGTLGRSQPTVQRWLGDIREYFPKSVVSVMQKDALERLNLKELLLEPEILETITPDLNLVETLVSLSQAIPERTKETARKIVRMLVDELMRKLRAKTIASVHGSLDRSSRTNRPRMNELDFHRTIKLNLKNWDKDRKRLIADKFVGYGKKRQKLRDVVVCVDESGSMADSVVYSSVFGAVLASMPALSTRLVLFDTSVVDLTDKLSDPVDVLFGAQLGGGTDINPALRYCQDKITRPNQTIFILITDLFDGGLAAQTLQTASELVESGVNFICLTALSDEGEPIYDKTLAQQFVNLGIPTFACTPDRFPDLLAAAIHRQDLMKWNSSLEKK